MPSSNDAPDDMSEALEDGCSAKRDPGPVTKEESEYGQDNTPFSP